MGSASDDHFSSDYAAARERFLAQAEARGAQVGSHPISARSEKGTELAVDVAYLGPEQPASVIAVSSGLHGVEGFAGSAIQSQLLQDQWEALALPVGCGVLLVHALNPYGFSALRRVNESNVDLNRNFVAHPDGHVDNPGYEALCDAINPDTLDEESDVVRRGRLLAYAQEHGFEALQAVLTVGQYRHPDGVQFGGRAPEESNALLREISVAATRGAGRVVWIDLHTGLGPFAEVEMISESPPDAPDYGRARAWWGDRVRSTKAGESLSPAVHGCIELGLAEALVGRELTAVAAEFGTYDPVRVFQAMRADNWLHQHGELDSEQGVAIKAELLEVFRPDDARWRAQVLATGARLVEQACAGLGSA